MRKTGLVVSLGLVLALVGLLSIAAAGSGGPATQQQYNVVCHRTFGKNAFVLIVTSVFSTQNANPGGAGHEESGSPPGHDGDIIFGPTDFQTAKAFWRANKDNADAACVAEQVTPGVPSEPPAQGQQGAAPVTG